MERLDNANWRDLATIVCVCVDGVGFQGQLYEIKNTSRDESAPLPCGQYRSDGWIVDNESATVDNPSAHASGTLRSFPLALHHLSPITTSQGNAYLHDRDDAYCVRRVIVLAPL
jgi:hypothetical protein